MIHLFPVADGVIGSDDRGFWLTIPFDIDLSTTPIPPTIVVYDTWVEAKRDTTWIEPTERGEVIVSISPKRPHESRYYAASIERQPEYLGGDTVASVEVTSQVQFPGTGSLSISNTGIIDTKSGRALFEGGVDGEKYRVEFLFTMASGRKVSCTFDLPVNTIPYGN